jgi:exonuclease SbcC
VINIIKDDFDKILAITHVEELKERFPVRIEVTKEPGVGSSFEVIYS